jgi:hypothetical protein
MAKITQLIAEWHRGTVWTASHLKAKGYNYDLINRYKSSQWIEAVGRGAYKLQHDKIEWFGALYAMQTQLGLKIHAGGKTALELKGYAHYLPANTKKVFLFGQENEKLPQWFKENNWEVAVHYVATNLFPTTLDDTFSDYQHRDFTIFISSIERGAMEMLYHVPAQQGFDEAMLIMENLATLRPDIVQRLLEGCNSVKVKRLFMFMAEKNNHGWVNQIDMTKINFGSGKRVIVKNGLFDKKYNITVPAESDY